MTAEDLARWNISVIEQKLLKPASYAEMRDALLTNGVASRYGLGLGVKRRGGHRSLSHGGEVSGFTADNVIFPTTGPRSRSSSTRTRSTPPARSQKSRRCSSGRRRPREARAREILAGLQPGKIDRSLFTANANSYFTDRPWPT